MDKDPESDVSCSQMGVQLILVIGGARSGKSTFAERLAAKSGRSVAYIATATASDEEMRARILRHQQERPSTWQTVEEPLDLAQGVRRGAELADVLILDCLTVWLSNWLFTKGDWQGDEQLIESLRYDEGGLAQIDALLALLAQLPTHKTLIVVTNEVGLGIVPAYALGRVYRDVLGRLNQRLAVAAQKVYLLVAGLAVDIKRLYEEPSL